MRQQSCSFAGVGEIMWLAEEKRSGNVKAWKFQNNGKTHALGIHVNKICVQKRDQLPKQPTWREQVRRPTSRADRMTQGTNEANFEWGKIMFHKFLKREESLCADCSNDVR